MNSYLIGIAAALIGVNLVFAQAVSERSGNLADADGRTLYTFDLDGAGRSACNGPCAAVWPPYAARDGASANRAFTIIVRDDGTKQWTQNGKPLYFYATDTRPGDMKGDGQSGVWHVVKQSGRLSAATDFATVLASIGYGYAY